MTYFDAAYIAKCYLNEPGCEHVRLLAASSGRVACCAHGRVEFAATVHRQCREGKITLAEKKLAFDQFDSDESNRLWVWLPLTSELLASAAAKFRLLESSMPLRAADALHLECAAFNGFKEICSNDRHLLIAAPAFGLTGHNVIS